jgi:hypothetical protein
MPRRTLPSPRSALLAAACAALLGAGCATTERVGDSATFAETVELYRLGDEHKALAVAVNERGRRAWGVLYGSFSEDDAREKALAECRSNAERAGVDAACHLFAVDEAAARDTVRACAEGRIGAQRCALQEQYGW